MNTASIRNDAAALSLSELCISIREEAASAKTAADTAMGHAIRCGELLIAAKTKVSHGSWAKWIEDNTDISHRTANAYMTLASNPQRVANLDSIRGALKLLADDKTAQQQAAPHASPPPAKPDKSLPLGAVHVDAEIVEPEATPEPLGIEPKDELFQQGLDNLQQSMPEKEYKDMLEHALLVQESKIEDGLSKLEADGMILPTILAMLPRLTKAEIKTLSETLNTRWL